MISVFLAGIIFALICIPLISAISECLVNWVGVLTTKAYERQGKISVQIKKYEDETGGEYSQTLPIGFAAPLPDDQEDYDE